MLSVLPHNPVTQRSAAKPSAGRKHSASNCSIKPGHIARPPNSFFLFRSDYVKSHYPLPKGTKISELSKMLGSIWRALPQAEKLPWEELAGRLKEEHSKKHPGYKYSPKRTRGNKRQGKTSKCSNKSPDVVISPGHRNLTPPPPLSPETRLPRGLMRYGESSGPSNWEDFVLVSIPESPHVPPELHGQPYCDPSGQQFPSVPIPEGSTNHSTTIRDPAHTNVLPSASPSSSTYGQHLHSVIKLGFSPIHLFPQAAPQQLRQDDMLGHSVQSTPNQEEYFPRLPQGRQIIYDFNPNHGFSPSSQPRQQLESSHSYPHIPPVQQRDVALTNLERGCNSHDLDHLSWDIPRSEVPSDSHMNIPPTQEADMNTFPGFSTQESGPSRARDAEAAHRQRSHHVEHMGLNAFGSLQSHVQTFGTNSNKDFKPSTLLEESLPAYIHLPQDPPQRFEDGLFSCLKGLKGVDTDGYARRFLGQADEARRSLPPHEGDSLPGEFNLVGGFTPSGSLSSRGSTQGSPPHLGPEERYLENSPIEYSEGYSSG